MRRPLVLSLSFVVLFGCASANDPYEDTGQEPGVPWWASGSATDEGKSTHLWIVNRGLAILGKHQNLPRAARAYAWLMNPACSERWRKGLDDADHKVGFNNWYTFQSHFYDPATGTNYLGFSSPVAYDKALEYLANARGRLANGDVKTGCYDLGLALHYVTDLLQPMHAANFAATDRPLKLHSNLEDYAADIQDRYTVSDWAGAPSGNAGAVLLDIAWGSNTLWNSMWGALANAYDARCDEIDDYYFDRTSCWKNDAEVDAAIGTALRRAQAGTAVFLYAADLP